MRNVLNRENVVSEYFVDDILELDLSTLSFGNYDFGEYEWTTVSDNEYCRPDLLSKRIYGTSNLWWFICWYNGFQDPWHDLQPDTGVKVVSVNRIFDGIKYAKQRASKVGS